MGKISEQYCLNKLKVTCNKIQALSSQKKKKEKKNDLKSHFAHFSSTSFNYPGSAEFVILRFCLDLIHYLRVAIN